MPDPGVAGLQSTGIAQYKGMSLYLIIVTGLLLCVSRSWHFLDLPEILRFLICLIRFKSVMAALHPRRSGGSKTGAGCTEPISLALAAAVAAAELEVRLNV